MVGDLVLRRLRSALLRTRSQDWRQRRMVGAGRPSSGSWLAQSGRQQFFDISFLIARSHAILPAFDNGRRSRRLKEAVMVSEAAPQR
jgi:hypothetical protein